MQLDKVGQRDRTALDPRSAQLQRGPRDNRAIGHDADKDAGRSRRARARRERRKAQRHRIKVVSEQPDAVEGASQR